MPTSYNQIAGQSVHRLEGLSDGIFAVAMTLLVLDLRVPLAAAVHSEGELASALAALAPQFLVYLMSVLTLGIFWVGQQTALNHLARSHRSFTWLQIVFLTAVSIVPFSTRLLSEFPHYRVALLVYWVNLVLLGFSLYLGWNCAKDLQLLRPETPPEVPRALDRRILVAQSLYALGALLCVISTWSITFLVLVQLNYAIAPRLWSRQS